MDTEAAADAVQSFYLKLCEMQQKEGNLDRIFYKGKLNMVYVFSSIRNILINEYRLTKHLEPIYEGIDEPLTESEPELSTDDMCACIKRELANMREYDRLMTLTYYSEDHSIRSLAETVGISSKNVFVTLKRVKDHMKSVILENPDKFPAL
jgi:RNA polymerase sigma factor (sigma-70 family)